MEPSSSVIRALSARLGAPEGWPSALAHAAALVDALPLPALVLGGSELIAAPNGAFSALFAAHASALAGAPLSPMAAKSDAPSWLAALAEGASRAFASGAPRSIPATSVSNEGAPSAVSFALTPVKGPGPAAKVEGVLVVARDEASPASAEVLVAAARRELYEEFAHMFALAAHDLKNPLNVISLSSYQLAMIPVAPELKERTKRLTDAVKRSIRRIDDLLNDLLDLAHLDVGPLALELGPIDATKLAEEMVETMSPVARAKSVLLDAKIEPALEIVGDRTRVVRLLSNLLGDAINITPEHGMVRFSVLADTDGVLFEVHDMGPGIPPAELAKVFDRRRVRRKEERPKQGRALPVAKSLIEAQRGRLTVESPPGLGTLVRFWLPMT